MKIIISENKVKTIKRLIKRQGVENVVQLMGGWKTFSEVLEFKNPMDFLHLFDDLEVVQSEEKPDLLLFRYEKGNNIMLYRKSNEDIFVNSREIYKIMDEKFSLIFPVFVRLIESWVDKVYNLKVGNVYTANRGDAIIV
jgi:hypothetical protein